MKHGKSTIRGQYNRGFIGIDILMATVAIILMVSQTIYLRTYALMDKIPGLISHNTYVPVKSSSLVESKCYSLKNGKELVFDRNSNYPLPTADIDSFEDLSTGTYTFCFGKDKYHVYYQNTVLPWADPTTFQIIWQGDNGASYDAEIYYFVSNGGDRINKITFEGYNRLATTTPSYIPRSDAKTFSLIYTDYGQAPIWAEDKNNVYCRGNVVAGVDPKSIVRDKFGVYTSDNSLFFETEMFGREEIDANCEFVAYHI